MIRPNVRCRFAFAPLIAMLIALAGCTAHVAAAGSSASRPSGQPVEDESVRNTSEQSGSDDDNQQDDNQSDNVGENAPEPEDVIKTVTGVVETTDCKPAEYNEGWTTFMVKVRDRAPLWLSGYATCPTLDFCTDGISTFTYTLSGGETNSVIIDAESVKCSKTPAPKKSAK